MHTLLLCLLVNSSIATPGTKTRGATELLRAECSQPLTPVIVVADGSSEWPAQAGNRIVSSLKSQIGPCYPVEVARFDAEPSLQVGFAVKGAERDLVIVRPRAPMREMMEAGLSSLIAYPRPRTMIVIAHAQTQATAVSTGRLIELAQRWAITVHTIHVASRDRERRGFRRLAHPARIGMSRLAHKLGQAETGYSASDTARLLKLVADGTGGRTCAAADKMTETACVEAIAGDLVSRGR